MICDDDDDVGAGVGGGIEPSISTGCDEVMAVVWSLYMRWNGAIAADSGCCWRNCLSFALISAR